ncbi:hypothetical protein [Psychromicrobium lacuslunae]|uniref:hypothetical protein n=1 Tax=Psychromicrobium lacuslunae TaxID=1618207 RepID=UPI0005D31957|nr:hypothetical protein [Psychromicrobium lacuslunae]
MVSASFAAALNYSRSESALGLLSPGRLFSATELQAMARDRVLQRIFGACYLPSGRQVLPEHRAVAMSLYFPAQLIDRLILGRFSAAWVHGCTPPPPRVTALLDHRRRAGMLPPFTQLQVHEVTLGRFDVVDRAGVRVTSVLRTAVDLAFQPRPTRLGWPDPVEVLAQLCTSSELACPTTLVLRAIESLGRVPYKQKAISRVSKLFD